jgi:hypothetical protein
MGCAHAVLIAPAVLLNNPAITREEFAKLLDETHASELYTYKPEELWSDYTTKTEDAEYHAGLEGLAEILGLNCTQEFIEFSRERKDEKGLPIYAPIRKDVLEVEIHEANAFKKRERIETHSSTRLKEGKIWEEPDGQGVVLRIFSEKKCKEQGYFYDMTVRHFYPVLRTEKFSSEQELFEKWPQFNPDFVFHWDQKNGHFTTDFLLRKNFLWIQKHGRYYLDRQTFDRIPASLRCSTTEFGYTDLVLTSEAVKCKAWKLLSRKGMRFFPQFINEFPDAQHAYERAVWDAHTSLSAKMQGMSITEFLRYRLGR